jgi:hypothetical protein
MAAELAGPSPLAWAAGFSAMLVLWCLICGCAIFRRIRRVWAGED